MPARTPREAVQELLVPVREAIACIAGDGFVARGIRPGGPHTATFQRGIVSLRRRGGLHPIRLSLALRYVVAEAGGKPHLWTVHTVEWIHEVWDAAGAPILAFHWHPTNSGQVTWPHVHAFGVNESMELHRLHIPTGDISIEMVVRFLIEDFAVIPRRHNWSIILARL